MFRSKTIFVLGAGASAEVGLPVGNTLLEQIVDLVDIKYDYSRQTSGDHLIASALKSATGDDDVDKYNSHLHAAWQIASSAVQTLSIDNIVDGLEDEKVELVAKLGIARAIQRAEKDSSFFSSKDSLSHVLDFGNFRDTWYANLTKLICENRRKSDLESAFENLTFISFNYDRCIEAYLPFSIADYYGVSVDEVLPHFLNVAIHRPYGIAGELKWNQTCNPIGFGGLNSDYLLEAAQRIRTFTEGVENPSALEKMRQDISAADRIVILGTAFHRQNLELLRTKVKSTASVLATSGNISSEDLKVIRGDLHDVFSIRVDDDRERISFAKMYCNKFFDTYWRTLTS